MEEISKTVSNCMNGLIPAGSQELEDGDYIGQDGLVYCGKCNTPRQKRLIVPVGIFSDGREKIVSCLCKCRAEAENRRKEQEKYQQEMMRLQRMRDASLMDSKYRDARFSNYQVNSHNQKAYRLAVNYSKRFDRMFSENQGLIFHGPVGTGKSFTSACIANELLDNSTSVIMTSFVKILQNIQKQDEAEYIAMLNSAKLLILDDLGTERNTDYALEKVYNIIDSRSRVSKPMVLTTNLSLDEMMDATDIRYKRIYDRILETCYPVEISGDSFRMQSAAQRFDRMAEFMEG